MANGNMFSDGEFITESRKDNSCLRNNNAIIISETLSLFPTRATWILTLVKHMRANFVLFIKRATVNNLLMTLLTMLLIAYKAGYVYVASLPTTNQNCVDFDHEIN